VPAARFPVPANVTDIREAVRGDPRRSQRREPSTSPMRRHATASPDQGRQWTRGQPLARDRRGSRAATGQGAHRAALGTVLRDARRGAFEVLCVWALDRLTGEGTLRTLEIVRDFGRAGVPVVSCQEGWTEQAGPVQELLLAIAGWVAEQESAHDRSGPGPGWPGLGPRAGGSAVLLGAGTASRGAAVAMSPARSWPGRCVPGAKQRQRYTWHTNHYKGAAPEPGHRSRRRKNRRVLGLERKPYVTSRIRLVPTSRSESTIPALK
jgi:hypothetical protein